MYGDPMAGTGHKIRGMISTIARILRERPDVLITYQSTASVLMGLFGSLASTPIRIAHQTAIPSAIHPFVRFLDRVVGSLNFYSVNVTNSRATESEFSSYPAAYRRAMRRIDHGLTTPVAYVSKAEALARHHIPDDGQILLCTGRLCDQKAQDRIIRALPHLRGIRLVLAGGGPSEADYKAVARDFRVADRVHFLGNIAHSEIGNLLNAADVFVIPSNWETFGLAAVEAAMYGVPVVANDIPVFREVLRETSTRFVDASDPVRFAAAIEECLSDSVARQARAKAPSVQERFSEAQMMRAYLQIIVEPR
jgi:glycosyltransferase involved in cell wall biosynthesis